MTSLTRLVCPSNFWHGFVGRVSSITVAGEDINIVPLGLRLVNQRTASVIHAIANIITYYKCVQALMLDTRFWTEAQRVKVASNVGVVE